jgi:hypothetical protein
LLGVTAEVGTVNFNLARKLGFGLDCRANGFADLVSENKRVLYWTPRSRDSANMLLPLTSLQKIAIAAR